ncbi:MAG: hypothetical protein IPP15_20285 [Saprospiraceae bacterium]|uniref:Uncharacterized protein n=1 Tax=Candidatus Opimibacter skivensis TaxID=2982028 RepID=A0A9D7XR09_9BACT|nr:hypothetical protein [Candidatus Opimibacter skivensis]
MINRQWTVSKDGAAMGNNVTCKYQWTSPTDEGAMFNNMGPVVIGHYSGGMWDETVASISNMGATYTCFFGRYS